MDIRQYHQLMQRQNLLRGEPVKFFLGGDFDLSGLMNLSNINLDFPNPYIAPAPDPAPTTPAPTTAPPTYNPPPVTVAPSPAPVTPPPVYTEPAPVITPPVTTPDPVATTPSQSFSNAQKVEGGYNVQEIDYSKPLGMGGYGTTTRFIPDSEVGDVTTTQTPIGFGMYDTSYNLTIPSTTTAQPQDTPPAPVTTATTDQTPDMGQPTAEINLPVQTTDTPVSNVPFNPFEVSEPVRDPDAIDREPIDTFNLDRSTEELIADEGTFFDDMGNLRRKKRMYEIHADRQGLPPIGTGEYVTSDVLVEDREGNVIRDPNFKSRLDQPTPTFNPVNRDPIFDPIPQDTTPEPTSPTVPTTAPTQAPAARAMAAPAGESFSDAKKVEGGYEVQVPDYSKPTGMGGYQTNTQFIPDSAVGSVDVREIPIGFGQTETSYNLSGVNLDSPATTPDPVIPETTADAGEQGTPPAPEFPPDAPADALPETLPDTTPQVDTSTGPDVFEDSITESPDIIETLDSGTETSEIGTPPVSNVPTQSFANAERTAGGYFVDVPTNPDNPYSSPTERFFVPNEDIIGDVTSTTTPLGYGIEETNYQIQLPEDYDFTQKFEPESVGFGTDKPATVTDTETGESFEPTIFDKDAPSGTAPEAEVQGPDTTIPEIGSEQGGTKTDPGDLTMEQILQDYLTPTDNFDQALNRLYLQTFGRFPTQEEFEGHKNRFGDKLDSIERKALFEEMLADSANTGPIGQFRSILGRDPESPEAVAAARGLTNEQFFQRATPELLSRNLGGIRDYANVMGINPTFSQFRALDSSLRGDPRLMRQRLVEQGRFQDAAQDAFRADLGYDPSSEQLQRLVDSGTFLNPREFRLNLARDLIANRPRFGTFNPDYFGGLTGSYNPYAAPFYNRFAPQPTFYRPPSYTMGFGFDPYRSSFNPFGSQMLVQPEMYRPTGIGFKG